MNTFTLAGITLAWVATWSLTTGRAAAQDCNGNGQSDAQDIDRGLSDDCNNNAVPDECEAPCASDVAPYPAGDGVVDVSDLLALLASWD
jgi:hypothetical protein